MSEQQTPTDDVAGRRTLAGVWLVGSCVIGMPAFFLAFASDLPGDRIAGWLLMVLVMLGVLGALVSLNSPAGSRFRITLLAAAMWFITGVLVFGSQDHLLDSFWAGGVPILTALAAAAVVLFSGRPSQVSG